MLSRGDLARVAVVDPPPTERFVRVSTARFAFLLTEMGAGTRKIRPFPALLFVFACSPLFSLAADTLGAGQSIADGQTLVSAGEEFEMGFFSPGRSQNRYVGIWYRKTPMQTVMWVANRASPVPDSSGSFALARNGSLLVLDGKLSVLWSSNTSAMSKTGASATLMDSGNFVVTSSGATLWQTFDHPGDTFVPGMSTGLDLKTHTNTLLTSWRSEDDPSVGNFSLGIDPRGLVQLVMWEGQARRWRSGLWNGQTFTSMPDIDSLNLRGPRFTNGDDGRILFMYVPYNSSYQRSVLSPNGVIQQTMWDESIKAWRAIFSQPSDECDVYNRCGAHGVCRAGVAPLCSCMRGYEPRSPDQWSNGNWSGGCVRRSPFECERNGSASGGGGGKDGFFKVEGVGLPDAPGWIGITDAEGCIGACLRNCSCRAYAYTRGIGCMLWSAELLDMHRLSRGGYEVYIRLAASDLDVRKRTSKVVIVAVVLVSILLSLSIFISWKCKNKIKGIWKRDIQESVLLDCETVEPTMEDSSLELPIFMFQSLSEATNSFSGCNMLGAGGFGPVYKGKLPGGQEIAVKRLSKGSGQGLEEFKNEVVLIAKLQHRNLVRLLGCCIKEDERILAYEYMPNRSLDTLLFDPKKKELLDWKTRFNIIHGIARGLLYLHQDSRLRIIHRDLKASNILLDEEMNPKISDFGLARTFGGNQNEANTKRVVGTYGYMAPEYAMDGIFSIKSDVYSFGVLLLEIVSGKKSKIVLHSVPSMSLLGDAWHLWNENKPMEFVDTVIAESSSPTEVLRCMHIGLLCVQSHPFARPAMASVVLMLGSEATSYPAPEQPIFLMDRGWTESDSSSHIPESSSTNELTVSVVTGR